MAGPRLELESPRQQPANDGSDGCGRNPAEPKCRTFIIGQRAGELIIRSSPAGTTEFIGNGPFHRFRGTVTVRFGDQAIEAVDLDLAEPGPEDRTVCMSFGVTGSEGRAVLLAPVPVTIETEEDYNNRSIGESIRNWASRCSRPAGRMAALAIMVAAAWMWPGCNAVSGKQGVFEVNRTTQVESAEDLIEQNAEVIRNAAVAVENRQQIAASQPFSAPVGGFHLGGGVTTEAATVATSQPANTSVGGVHVGSGQVNNTGTDPWLYRGTVWGAIGGAFLLSAWFARWQAKRHGYKAGRKRRLRTEDPNRLPSGWSINPPPKPPLPSEPPPPQANETTTRRMNTQDAIRARDQIVRENMTAWGLRGDMVDIRDALLGADSVLLALIHHPSLTRMDNTHLRIDLTDDLMDKMRKAKKELQECVHG